MVHAFIDEVRKRRITGTWLDKVNRGVGYDGSTRSLKEVAIWIDPACDSLDGAKDGYVTYSGYTDRWHRMRPAGACSSIGLDCILIVMQNVPISYAASSHNPGKLESDVTDYDVCAKAGFWCISFPN
jgi:hypothetical protein